MTIPTYHQVDAGGYGDPRDGESWCSCGWEDKEDVFAQHALHHSMSANRQYYRYLEDLAEAARQFVGAHDDSIGDQEYDRRFQNLCAIVKGDWPRAAA